MRRSKVLRPGHHAPRTAYGTGLSWPWQLMIAAMIVVAAQYLWEQSGATAASATQRFMWWPVINERTGWIPWIPISVLVVWRWGFVLLHWCRSAIYRHIVFPVVRRNAERAVVAKGPVPELAVLAVTYKEDAMITKVVFGSIFDEVARVEGLKRQPVVVAVTGSREDDDNIWAAYEEMKGRTSPQRVPQLVLLRGTEGKRRALAAGLEWVNAWRKYPDGAFVMMDGDTHLEPGAISGALCFLRLDPPVYAMTTDEHVLVDGPGWFSEWLHLRHGVRDLHACSISLSGRLLCLTGRYSIFRADALDDEFIEIVRNDHVNNWLWGRYALLSGDDKSTWYHLLARGVRMLYLPDVAVVTHEIVRGSSILRAYHNLRRWGGNAVRNSERAILLGPSKVGLFTWWCLLDQRISMWTVLVGPLALTMMALGDRWDLACAYLLWVIVSRTIRVAPAWLHARRLSVIYAPLSALLDWASALVKIWIIYFPAKQFWFNRGHRELDSTVSKSMVKIRRIAAGGMLGAGITVLVSFVAWLTGTLQVDRDVFIMLAEVRHGGGRLVVAAFITLLVGLALIITARLRQGAHDV